MAERRQDSQLVHTLDAMGRRGFAYAFQILRNRDDALDAVQSSLTSIWQRRDRLDPNRDWKPWFYRVLRNRCVDMLRAGRLRHTAALNDEPCDTAMSDPADSAVRGEQLARLRRELERLPEDMREIIMLRDYHDLSYAAIAEVLDIRPGTVMSRLHRARSALRARMLARESCHD